ncbi:MAG: histidine kinase, partial [Alistipes sp.]|nr:histidine kinase [Alistipes sp.]
MRQKRKILYLKSIVLALGLTIVLHFFILLLLAGYNAFNSPFVIPFDTVGFRRGMLPYSFISIFFFLLIEFLIVFKIQGGSRRYKIGWIALGVFAAASMYGLVVMTVYNEAYLFGEELTGRIYLGSLIGNGVLSIIVVLISYLDFVLEKQRQIAVENESLKSQTIQSRYQALKNQIDPHFLFNTFSSLTSMIELDAACAQEFSIRMSSVLRYTLQIKDVVTLREEMDFARDYCELMQLRYGDNLAFNFSVDGQYDSYLVVPLSVQTLIENAVKHNEISNR